MGGSKSLVAIAAAVEVSNEARGLAIARTVGPARGLILAPVTLIPTVTTTGTSPSDTSYCAMVTAVSAALARVTRQGNFTEVTFVSLRTVTITITRQTCGIPSILTVGKSLGSTRVQHSATSNGWMARKKEIAARRAFINLNLHLPLRAQSKFVRNGAGALLVCQGVWICRIVSQAAMSGGSIGHAIGWSIKSLQLAIIRDVMLIKTTHRNPFTTSLLPKRVFLINIENRKSKRSEVGWVNLLLTLLQCESENRRASCCATFQIDLSIITIHAVIRHAMPVSHNSIIVCIRCDHQINLSVIDGEHIVISDLCWIIEIWAFPSKIISGGWTQAHPLRIVAHFTGIQSTSHGQLVATFFFQFVLQHR